MERTLYLLARFVRGIDDIFGDSQEHPRIQVRLGTIHRRRVIPQLDDVEVALGRCREADKRILLRGHDIVFADNRMHHQIDGDLIEVLGWHLLAPRSAILVLGNFPDGTKPATHEEEVSTFPGILGNRIDDGPELLRGGDIGDFLVVDEAPVLHAGIEIPQNPVVLEFGGLRDFSERCCHLVWGTVCLIQRYVNPFLLKTDLTNSCLRIRPSIHYNHVHTTQHFHHVLLQEQESPGPSGGRYGGDLSHAGEPRGARIYSQAQHGCAQTNQEDRRERRQLAARVHRRSQSQAS